MDVRYAKLAAVIVLSSLAAAPAGAQEPAIRPEVILQVGPESPVKSVAFSPDGERLACVGDDATVFVWAVRSRGLEFAVALGGPLNAVAFSPDGKLIAVAGNAGTLGAAFVLDGADGRTLHEFEAPGSSSAPNKPGTPREAVSVAFSRDSKAVIAAFEDGTVTAWDTESGAQQATSAGKGGWQVAMALSRDGKTLACGTREGSIRLLDSTLLATLRSIESGSLSGLAFSPDGKTLAGCGFQGMKGIIWFWDTTTGTLKSTITGTGGSHGVAYDVEFSPDGQTLAVNSGDAVAVVSLKTGRPVRSLPVGDAAIQGVAFSPDGRTLACGAKDASVKLWDAGTGKLLYGLEGLPPAEASVVSAAFSPDGRTLAYLQTDGLLSLWGLVTIPPSRTVRLSSESLLGGYDTGPLAFSPDGTLLAGTVGGQAQVWNARTLEPAKLVFKSGARMILPGEAEEPGKTKPPSDEIASLLEGEDRLEAVAFSPDGTLLASDAGDIWDTKTGGLKRTLSGRWAVAFSPDGKTLATGGTDKPEVESGVAKGRAAVKLWDVETGKLKRLLPGDEGLTAFSVAFSPDGRMVAGGMGPLHGNAKGKTVLWNADTGEAVRTFEGHILVSILKDGKTLVTSDLGQAPKFWDAQTGRLVRTLGPPGGVTAFALSLDGTRAAVGRTSGDITVWDAATGKPLLTLLVLPFAQSESKPQPMEWIAYTPDGLFDSSPGIAKHIRWRVGGRLLTTKEYESAYHLRQPEAVREAILAE